MPVILPSSRLSAILRQDTVSARFLFDTTNEEIDKCPCPHGERYQALMLCSLDCATSGAHPDRKTKADGRFIVTPWWCIHKCKWFSEHKNEVPKKP